MFCIERSGLFYFGWQQEDKNDQAYVAMSRQRGAVFIFKL